MQILRRRAQNTAEYAILISLVVGVVITMRTYVGRGVQGRIAAGSDRFVDELSTSLDWDTVSNATDITSADALTQWEPEQLSSQRTRTTFVGTNDTETFDKGGTVTRKSTEITSGAIGDYQQYDY